MIPTACLSDLADGDETHVVDGGDRSISLAASMLRAGHVVALPPDEGLGVAIGDRLRRAAQRPVS